VARSLNLAAMIKWRLTGQRERGDTIRRYVRVLCKAAPRQSVPVPVLRSLVDRLYGGKKVTNAEVMIAASEVFTRISYHRPFEIPKGKYRPRCLTGIKLRGGTPATSEKIAEAVAEASPVVSIERKLHDYMRVADWSTCPKKHRQAFKMWVNERASALAIATRYGLSPTECQLLIDKHRLRAGLYPK
jgi:hypothetical protein